MSQDPRMGFLNLCIYNKQSGPINQTRITEIRYITNSVKSKYINKYIHKIKKTSVINKYKELE